MTNYEKIKNMSVKEMAEFIYETESEPIPYCGVEHRFKCEKPCSCDDCRIKWLTSEVEK